MRVQEDVIDNVAETVAVPHAPVGALATAQVQLARTAERLKLDAATRDLLAAPLREFQFAIPIRMDDGSSRVFRGVRVQHNDARGPGKGGIRFSPSSSVDDVRALAMWMSWKCALLDLPLGGAKGLVQCDPTALSPGEQERICRGWVRQMVKHVGPRQDVPAPDMMTSAQHMLWMLDEYEVLTGERAPGFITGKPVGMGGSPGRTEATGYGVVFVLREALADLGLPVEKSSASIQGFGNVARYAAERYTRMGGTLVAVSCWDRSDQRAYTYRRHKGIDVQDLASMTDAFGSIDRRKAAAAGYDVLAGSAWLEESVDVLIPAAREGQITADNVASVAWQVKLVVEAANGPTTPEADAALERGGIKVIPDVLANAGGVTCSYFEQVQGNTGYYWSREDVINRLDERMTGAYRAVADMAIAERLSQRDAASMLAVERVAQACRQRGWV